MEVIVGSKFLAVDTACALDASGREHLVVIAKSSWQIPRPGQRPRPLPPLALQHADVFLGEPGDSPMLYGSDMVRFKPRCDVLFNASAYAPDGAPFQELAVAWQVGALRKGLRVHGPRYWRKRLGLYGLTEAAPVTHMPLHFGMAFGGTRSYTKGSGARAETLCEAYLANPAGLGWFGDKTDEEAVGQPAPCLEALDEPVRKPGGSYAPAAFSAIARHWQPRPAYAGTYDDAWQRDVFPFLPNDFDEQFNQCAPADQQMPYPVGGEHVVLKHLMAGRPTVRFRLPRLDTVTVRILRADYTSEEPIAVADTLYFEPDLDRFSVVWRASVPIKRRLQEFLTVAVGPVSTEWWHRKAMGIEGCDGCSEASDSNVLETQA
jgi:hypothetical protein